MGRVIGYINFVAIIAFVAAERFGMLQPLMYPISATEHLGYTNVLFWNELKLTDKPGSVVDSHSSRPAIAHWLKQPTRVQYGPYHVNPYLALLRVEFTVPRTVTSRAVRSYRTLSPLPDPACAGHRRFALCCTGRGFPPQALPGTLPYGARTFLPSARLPRKGRRRSGDCLVSFGAQYRGFARRCHPQV